MTTTGNNYDPIWEAYQGATPELQYGIRDMFSKGYTMPQLAAALTFILAEDVSPRQVDTFQRKLSQGRVSW